MRTGALVAVIVVALLTFGCGGSSSNANPASAAIAFDTARATSDVQQLAGAIGPRPPGSDASRQAADYIADQLAKAKYGIVRSTVTYETDPNRDATVTDGALNIAATTLAGTKAGSASGAAVSIGAGDVAGKLLAGTVAIATRGPATFSDIYIAASGAGAVALIIVNNDASPLVGRLPAAAAIPVVGVSNATGAALKSAAESGAQLMVTVPPPQTVTTEDVVARPPNGDPCIVVLGANYDTVAGTPGANDNASGIAILLEVARQMAVPKASPPACFVAFGARVDGAQGSTTYVSRLPSTPRLTAMVNIYGLGAGSNLVFYGDNRLASTAAGAASAAGLQSNPSGGRPSYVTDADAFRAVTVPALDITTDRFSTALDPADTPGKVDSKTLTRAGKAVLAFFQTLARDGGP
jgi:aminopeptidase YwaD